MVIDYRIYRDEIEEIKYHDKAKCHENEIEVSFHRKKFKKPDMSVSDFLN